MVNPKKDDVGRAVIYTGNRYPGGKTEEGVITSFNEATVFVRYGADKHSKGTSPADLEWSSPRGYGTGQSMEEAAADNFGLTADDL